MKKNIFKPDKRRPKIPSKVEALVIFRSDFQCCICKKKGHHIHHLNGNNADNAFRNLALLCFDHHNDATIQASLSKKLSKNVILKYRELHYKTIDAKRNDDIKETQKTIQAVQEIDSSYNLSGKNGKSTLLARKNFSVAEIAEFTNILGYNCLIRKIDTFEYFNFYMRDFWHYEEIKTPKLFVFEVSNSEPKKIGVGLIRSLEFKLDKYLYSKGLKYGKLEWYKVKSFQMRYNHIDYNLQFANGKKNSLIVSSDKFGSLSGKTLNPKFFLINVPEEINIETIDIQVELIAIDFLLNLLLKFKEHKPMKIYWTYKLQSKQLLNKKISKLLLGLLPNNYCWILKGKFEQQEFVEIIFYRDVNQKLCLKPVFKNKIFDNALNAMIRLNQNEFRYHKLNSVFLDYYIQKVLN